MSYFMYQLQFDTPIHFGTAEQGGKLEQIGFTLSSDTLFGAICCELSEQAESSVLKDFLDKCNSRKILFSDLLPYKMVDGEAFDYLPKPIMPIAREENAIQDIQQVRIMAAERKKMKKLSFIRASRMEEYAEKLRQGQPFVEDNDFGVMSLIPKVYCRDDETRPYYVAEYSFNNESGLYGIIYVDDDDDFEWLCDTIQGLGLSGIGGKRSSGFGKFHFLDDPYDLNDGGFSPDDEALVAMLQNREASWQMGISSVIPGEDELSLLEGSYYQLRKRSGFVTLENGIGQEKKNSVYALAAGSCFTDRLSGSIALLGTNAGHDVLRNGHGMFVGLEI